MERLPITVIGGYLGAGKTTLLNSILRRADGRRIGIVVNDFGELGIDASLLAMADRPDGADPQIVHLANGCVCCTLGDDLHATLMLLAGQTPPLDHVVVEVSGVADPAATASWGTVAPFVPGGVVVLAAADAIDRQVQDRYVGGEVRRQLERADVVVLTKLDRCSDHQDAVARRTVSEFTAAPVIDADHGSVPVEVVLADEPSGAFVPTRAGAATSDVADHVSDHGQGHVDAYVRWSSSGLDAVSADDVRAACSRLPAGLLRLKGILNDVDVPAALIVVQVVGSDTLAVDRIPAREHQVEIGLTAIGVVGVLAVDDLNEWAATIRRHDRPR